MGEPFRNWAERLPFKMTLGRGQIKEARRLLGWSQIALAVRAGVGINQLKNFESGLTVAGCATIAALQRSFEAAGVQFVDMQGGGAAVRLPTEQKAPGKTLSVGRAMATPGQVAILAMLPNHDEGPIPLSVVFERLNIRKPTNVQRASVSRSLARLAERGLAQRRSPNAYRREKIYLWSKAQD